MRLVVFAKAPAMGRAKTRLARGIGVVHAQRLYRAMTARVLRQVTDARWTTHVSVTPDGARLPLWNSHTVVDQGAGGLTDRLLRALRAPGPVCVIGTDCPEVTARDIADAFAALRSHALVLGRADDGGFWLIGARGPVSPSLFANVRWSSEHALADVAANADGSVAYLRTLTDVDDLAALNALRRRGARARPAGPATHPS